MKQLEPEHLLDLVTSCGKPACAIRAPSALLIRIASVLQLERQYYRFENTPHMICARPETQALPLIEKASELFRSMPLAKDIENSIAEVKNMSAAAAILFIGDRLILKRGIPADQLLLGLLYGYPPCCVRYGVERLYNGTRHAHETHDGFGYYVRCETCAKADIWAPWCK